MKTYLTKDFTLEEMLESSTAREHNIAEQWEPPQEVIQNLTNLCINLLQPLRDALGPIYISSGWRCARLNTLIGGVPNSWHLLGEAADCEHWGTGQKSQGHDADAITQAWGNQAIIDTVKRLNLPFDQMIDEQYKKWIHLSYSTTQCRKQMLVMVDGKYTVME